MNPDIKTLQAKWLDPECHSGCNSLVLKEQIKNLTVERDALTGWLELSTTERNALKLDLAQAESNRKVNAELYERATSETNDMLERALKAEADRDDSEAEIEALKVQLDQWSELLSEKKTLRDEFAMCALSGLIQSAQYGGELKRIFDRGEGIANAGDNSESPQSYTSRIALSLADAMMEARKKDVK